MSCHEWTRQKKIKLIDLYRQTPILWARRGQKVHPKQRSLAMQQIADEIGMNNVLEVEKKLHVLRSQFMRERKKVVTSQLNGEGEIYHSHWQYYKKLEFLLESLNEPSTVNKAGKPNSNTGKVESSNQAASKGEMENETDDISLEDVPTQLNMNNINRQSINEEPSEMPDYNNFYREDQSFPNPDESGFTVTLGVPEESAENMDFYACGIDDSLVQFGNYLIALMKRLPLDKSYQLQQKFIKETQDTTIQFEKERMQLKRRGEYSQPCNQNYIQAPSGSRQEHSRVDRSSNKRAHNRNNAFDASGSSHRSGQGFQLNKLYSLGEDLNINSNNNTFTDISFEEGPQVKHIKKEFETNFETVFCNGPPSDLAVTENTSLPKHLPFQCKVCRKEFQTNTELEGHNTAEHSESQVVSASKEEVAPKRQCLQNRV